MEAPDYVDSNITEFLHDDPELYFNSHLSQVSLTDIMPSMFEEVPPSPAVTAEIEDNSRDYNIKEEIQEYTVVQIHKPIQQYGPPTRGDDPGQYDFQVHVNGNDTHKKKYLYSVKLNRIYVCMDCCFSLQFSWNFRQTMAPMFVRSTLVFSDTSQYEKRVEMCIQHEHMGKERKASVILSRDSACSNPKNVYCDCTYNQSVKSKLIYGPYYTKYKKYLQRIMVYGILGGSGDPLVNHVLRSARDKGAEGVTYCGDVSRSDSWYSVLVQFNNLPDTPAQTCTHAYMFTCKNSCSSGINRRSIEMLFTLEDSQGRVHGRQTVGVRVCACPRRDIVKDEGECKKSKAKKRVAHSTVTTDRPASKKIQLEVVPTPNAGDDKVYTLNSEVVGSKVLETGLTVMVNMMEEAAARADPQSLEKYTKCITNMKATLEQLKNTDKK